MMGGWWLGDGTTGARGEEASGKPSGKGKRLHALRGHHWPRRRTGPGAQKRVAVSKFRPRTIPGPSPSGNKGTRLLVDPRRKPGISRSVLRDVDRIVNSGRRHRMIPSTTYFLSLPGTLIGDHPPCLYQEESHRRSSTRLVDAGRWLDSSWRRNDVSNVTIMCDGTAS